MRKYQNILLLLAFPFLFSCDQPVNKKTGEALDTVVTGKIKIMVDEGYKPIIETSIDVFDSIYRQATIDPIYTSEAKAVDALIRDSIQVIVITRKLTTEELEFFRQRGFTPAMTPIAHDAVAFVVNPANKDTVLTVAQIRDILTGKAPKWSAINAKNAAGDIHIVFDNPLSGTVRYCKDSIINNAPLPANASALQTNEEVIKYVSQQKNAIGIISANWISDTDDKGVQRFLKEVQLVDVAPELGKEGFGPYQAYLALNKYPFKRTIYIINAQARKGLGLGFASFLAGSDGQRIVMKDGLLPAQIQPRIIQTRKE
jgi:phosphate transport system substrate-binding protein